MKRFTLAGLAAMFGLAVLLLAVPTEANAQFRNRGGTRVNVTNVGGGGNAQRIEVNQGGRRFQPVRNLLRGIFGRNRTEVNVTNVNGGGAQQLVINERRGLFGLRRQQTRVNIDNGFGGQNLQFFRQGHNHAYHRYNAQLLLRANTFHYNQALIAANLNYGQAYYQAPATLVAAPLLQSYTYQQQQYVQPAPVVQHQEVDPCPPCPPCPPPGFKLVPIAPPVPAQPANADAQYLTQAPAAVKQDKDGNYYVPASR